MSKNKSDSGIVDIKLSEKYKIAFDGRNYTLTMICKAKESGNTYEKPLGYYGSLLKALMAYIEQKNYDENASSDLDKYIETYKNIVDNAREDIKKAIVNIELSMKKQTEEIEEDGFDNDSDNED